MVMIAKTLTTVVILVSILLGHLLAVDPKIDLRIKLLHYTMKGMFKYYAFKGEIPWSSFRDHPPKTSPGLKDNIVSVDLTIPPAPESVFPGINPLEPVKIRLYHPMGEVKEKLPIVFYVHGGGFTMGSAVDENFDNNIRDIVKTGPYLGISVDYRLAPEHKLPAVHDDCLGAVLWAASGTDPLVKKYGDVNKIVLVGDSVGASVVAALVQYLEAHYPNVHVVYQVLIYPTVHLADHESTESFKQHSNGYILSHDAMAFFNEACQPKNQQFLDSYIYRNLNRKDYDYSRLPPGHVLIADYDILRDHGKRYYETLKAAGVDMKLNFYPNMIHGFLGLTFLPESQQAIKDITDNLKIHLSK